MPPEHLFFWCIPLGNTENKHGEKCVNLIYWSSGKQEKYFKIGRLLYYLIGASAGIELNL